MHRWIILVALALAACAPDGDSGSDAAPDGTPDPGPDADADVPLPDDAGAEDPGSPDADADSADDGPPPHAICRYECDGDEDCTTIYGADWRCRALAAPAERLCLRLCSEDDDCRFGGASDPLMICIDGACGMRPCEDVSECTWVNASAVCQDMTFGSIMTCQQPCGTEDDCRTGAPTDVLWACRSGLCVWGCDNDDECRSAFSSSDYGCRTPRTTDGPSCYHACVVRDDCLTGGTTDRMVDCR
jgi:hypothetical protein